MGASDLNDSTRSAPADPSRPPTRLLFVCLGNICRSPTAEGVFAHLAAKAGLSHRFEIDSAGTGGWHQGDPPDPRAVEAAGRRGIDLSALRARKVQEADFHRFDLMLAMDRSNLTDLEARKPYDAAVDIALMTSFAGPGAPEEVGDPYYGGPDGFEGVLDLLERACAGLIVAKK